MCRSADRGTLAASLRRSPEVEAAVETESVKRKLTTILSADVAAYSRLMGADEEGTLRALSASRRLIDERIATHHGRIFSTAGDGLVAEFDSAVEAVRCATEIQQRLADTSATLPPERRMEFRIGVNLGDVMVERDNLFGEGVNVAAWLQELAAPGGICLSGTVFDQVRARLDLTYEDLGARNVKNIADPVRTYRVRREDERSDAASEAPTGPRRNWRPLIVRGVALVVVFSVAWVIGTSPPSPPTLAEPTIAVLPFRTIGDEEAQNEFSDGLTQDLIVALSAHTGMRVIVLRPRAARPAGGDASRRQPTPAHYRLEGSVRAAGDHLRVTAQLVDTASGYHLWGGRYDRELTDTLALQEELSARIVATLAYKLEEAESERSTQREERGLQAGTYFVRGLEYLGRLASQAVMMPQGIYRRISGGGQNSA